LLALNCRSRDTESPTDSIYMTH